MVVEAGPTALPPASSRSWPRRRRPGPPGVRRRRRSRRQRRPSTSASTTTSEGVTARDRGPRAGPLPRTDEPRRATGPDHDRPAPPASPPPRGRRHRASATSSSTARRRPGGRRRQRGPQPGRRVGGGVGASTGRPRPTPPARRPRRRRRRSTHPPRAGAAVGRDRQPHPQPACGRRGRVDPNWASMAGTTTTTSAVRARPPGRPCPRRLQIDGHRPCRR